jgi:hypothetical protein
MINAMSDYWTAERVRRITIVSRKPKYGHLLSGIPERLGIFCLYPDKMKVYNILPDGSKNNNEVMENLEQINEIYPNGYKRLEVQETAETCGAEIVKVGSLVTYYIEGISYKGKIVKIDSIYGFENSTVRADVFQDLVDIHVGNLIEY